MGLMVKASSLLTVLLAVIASSGAVQKSYFYNFGQDAGDTSLPPFDDISSPEISLRVPIIFFEQVYNSIFVSRLFLLFLYYLSSSSPSPSPSPRSSFLHMISAFSHQRFTETKCHSRSLIPHHKHSITQVNTNRHCIMCIHERLQGQAMNVIHMSMNTGRIIYAHAYSGKV